MNNKLNDLKQNYDTIPIPSQLDDVVTQSFRRQKRTNHPFLIRTGAGIAALFILFLITLNTNAAFAQTTGKLPVIGAVIKVLTFRDFKLNEQHYKANIKVPQVSGMENHKLQEKLNQKYIKESTSLYNQFKDTMKKLKASNFQGHLSVDSGYLIKTNTSQLLSVERYVTKSAGSSTDTLQFDTVDKKNHLIITLPSLFKNDTYIKVISDTIKQQMKEQMKTKPGVMYFIQKPGQKKQPGSFDQIKANQTFYINKNNKLVIAFNKYAVAPGVMGTPEFVIPTSVIQDYLVSNYYIK